MTRLIYLVADSKVGGKEGNLYFQNEKEFSNFPVQNGALDPDLSLNLPKTDFGEKYSTFYSSF